jgi:hypothetical protein
VPRDLTEPSRFPKARESDSEYLLGLNDKTVVFGYHNEDFLTQLAGDLQAEGRKAVLVNGDTDSIHTQIAIEKFQDKNAGVQFFIGNKVGTAIDLQAADHVVR